MGEVVALVKPIEQLVLDIRGHVHDAGRAETTCAKHQLQAGWALIALRKRVEAGEAGDVSWWDWYETQFTGHIKSRKHAEKLMRWAQADDPEGAVTADRQKNRDREAARRAGAHVCSTDDDAEPSSSERTEYDIVEHALRLVQKMDGDERERFDEEYRREFQ